MNDLDACYCRPPIKPLKSTDPERYSCHMTLDLKWEVIGPDYPRACGIALDLVEDLLKDFPEDGTFRVTEGPEVTPC